jgi:hypothetical protein
LTLEDRILIHCSEADQTYEQDQLTLEVRCIIASEELTYHEEVDALWVRKAVPALDHPETTVEHCSLSIIKLHRIEALEINQTFEEQYQKVHDRLIVQEYVIENTLIETYFISKEDLDDLLEIESLMNERRTGITVKRDLTNISQNLSKINLNGKPGMTRILHRLHIGADPCAKKHQDRHEKLALFDGDQGGGRDQKEQQYSLLHFAAVRQSLEREADSTIRKDSRRRRAHCKLLAKIICNPFAGHRGNRRLRRLRSRIQASQRNHRHRNP